jgi:hypothetical protein
LYNDKKHSVFECDVSHQFNLAEVFQLLFEERLIFDTVGVQCPVFFHDSLFQLLVLYWMIKLSDSHLNLILPAFPFWFLILLHYRLGHFSLFSLDMVVSAMAIVCRCLLLLILSPMLLLFCQARYMRFIVVPIECFMAVCMILNTYRCI